MIGARRRYTPVECLLPAPLPAMLDVFRGFYLRTHSNRRLVRRCKRRARALNGVAAALAAQFGHVQRQGRLPARPQGARRLVFSGSFGRAPSLAAAR